MNEERNNSELDSKILVSAPAAMPRRRNLQSVVKNILSTYVLYGINMIIGLAVAPILLRELDDGQYGVMNSAAASWQYLGILSLGANTIILRQVPKVTATWVAIELERTISTFLLFNLLVALAGGLAGITLGRPVLQNTF